MARIVIPLHVLGTFITVGAIIRYPATCGDFVGVALTNCKAAETLTFSALWPVYWIARFSVWLWSVAP